MWMQDGIETILDLKAGMHIGQIYQTEAEHRYIIMLFLQQGLEKNEKMISIVDAHTPKDILEYLKEEGLDVEKQLELGQFTLINPNESYTKNGVFDPDRMINLLKLETEKASNEGYSGLRITDEMTWALKGGSGFERLIEYETKLNNFFSGSNAAVICQYDKRRFDAETLSKVLPIHPIVVIGTEVYENHSYGSPEEFISQEPSEAILNNWISNLIQRKKQEAEREEILCSLRESREELTSLFELSRLIEIPITQRLSRVLERLAVEEGLKKSEERIRNLLETTSDWIWEVDQQGRFTYASPKVKDLLGYEPEEILGKTPFDLMTHDEAKRIRVEFGPVFKDKKPVHLLENINVRRDGHPVVLETSCVPFFDSDGNLSGYRGVDRDITGRKLIEQKLRESEARFRGIVDMSVDAILVTDEERRVEYMNPSAEEIFACKKEDLIGKDFGFTITGTEYVEINISRLDKEPGTGEMKVVETEWLGKKAHLVIIRDITKRKDMENELLRTNEELKKVDQLKSDFISTVSHELRTPLTTIKEFASIISDEIPGKLTKEQREYVDIIKGNIDRLARLINDLLDISKIEAGRVELKKAFIDLIHIVEGVVSTLKAEADRKHIAFKILFPASLSEVFADPDKMVQVFTNLIGNAIKFTPENGKITIEIKDKKKEIECIVSDTGIGIAPENIKKLFSRFRQFNREAGAGSKGTGLGLAITKELVEMHQGKIWVESKVNKGCKFFFSLSKQTAETILDEYVTKEIREAMNSNRKMSLMVISIVKIKEPTLKLSSERIDAILKDIVEISKGWLRREQSIILNVSKKLFIILTNCDKENLSKIRKRIKSALRNYLVQKELTRTIKLIFNLVVYPDDAQDAKIMIQKGSKESR